MLLRPGGLFLLHTIGGNESQTCTDAWIDKYVFPNGLIPSMAQLSIGMDGLWVVEDWHNFGPDYDKTLMAWWQNFERAWPTLRQKYGDRFYRMWKYYLLGCAGGFRARRLQLSQIVLSKGDSRHTRPSGRTVSMDRIPDREAEHRRRSGALASQLLAARGGGVSVGLEKKTSNLFRRRERGPQLSLDVRRLNHVLSVDRERMTADVEGMTTYGTLVDETLRCGLLPAVVPQLKTSRPSARSAVWGSSHPVQYGLVHSPLKRWGS